MIIIWDNGAEHYDGHDVEFFEAGEHTIDEVVAFLALVEPAGRVIGTTSRIVWTSRKGPSDPAEHVAENLHLYVLDDEDLVAARQRFGGLVGVPTALLERLVAAMRAADRDEGAIRFFRNALTRRRRAESKAKRRA